MRTATRHIVHLENGWLGGTTRADVHELFRSFAAHPNSDCLVVHIHGGLVNEAAGVAIADRLAPAYIAAGGYPLFFVWESGPLEILVDVAADLGRDPVFRAVLQPTVTFARVKLEQTAAEVAVSAAAREPEIGELTAHGEPFAFEPDRLPPDAALTPGEEARFVAALERDAGVARARAAAPWISARLVSGAIAVLTRCIDRFAAGRGHGVYPTVVEEIFREFYLGSALTGLWNLMKRSTARAFGPDAQRFGGTAVLDELGQAWRAGHRPRVILVGHSTGAIAICHWLAHAQAWLPPDARFDVVLLAPACTCGLLARTIDDHGARIGGLRSFGMCDDLERTDQLVPGLYPRSLLYFVSGVLEDTADEPLVGMARHVSGRPPFDAAMPEVSTVASFMASRPGGLVWSPAVDEPGRASLATRHEDFDDDAVTLASLASVITSGF